MRQTSGDAAAQAAQQAKAAQQLAKDAIATAQRSLKGENTGPADVRVEQNAAGITISIPDEDGDPQVIVLSRDGHQIKSIENMSASAIIPAAPRKRDLPDNLIPLMGIVCGMVFITTVFGPIFKALARRVEKRADAMPSDAAQRLAAIEAAVETVAVEVERISEGQRFTAKLLSDRASDRASERAKDAMEVR